MFGKKSCQKGREKEKEGMLHQLVFTKYTKRGCCGKEKKFHFWAKRITSNNTFESFPAYFQLSSFSAFFWSQTNHDIFPRRFVFF
jgi:hypothetical protein